MVLDDPDFASTFAFDAVNLDLVLSPFPDVEAPLEGTWNAIRRLLDVQWNHGKEFDLFITFKGNPSDTDKEALDELAELLKTNLDQHRGSQEFQGRVGHLDPNRLLADDYVTFLCMGLPKLLIGDGLALGYVASPVKIFKYVPESDYGEIVKFVFSFEFSNASFRTFAQPPSFIRNYEDMVPMAFNTVVTDVDATLATAPALKKELEQDLDDLASSSMIV